MSEGSQVSKVTLCVKILKWQSPKTTTPRVGIELPGQLKTNKPIITHPIKVERVGPDHPEPGNNMMFNFDLISLSTNCMTIRALSLKILNSAVRREDFSVLLLNETCATQFGHKAANLSPLISRKPPVEGVEPEENNHGSNDQAASVASVRGGCVGGRVVEPPTALVVPSSEGF